MTSNDIRKKYLEFFQSKGHAVIPPASLIPQNDPTTLFTSSGMQPLVPFLKGEPHPMGKRLVDSQPSFRAEDIEEVGDNRHTTFFEMLGNWSLGDYFKNEQIPWIFEFVTKELGLDPNRIYVTVFAGNDQIEKDETSISLWQNLFQNHSPAKNGLEGFDPSTKIYMYDAKKNWWSRSGIPANMPAGEIGGPDSEMFYDFGEELHLHENSIYKNEPCHVNCDCGRFIEFGNSVFMQFIKKDDGTFEPLQNVNVDFGGGLERVAAALNNNPDMFKIDLLSPAIDYLVEKTGKPYEGEFQPPMRVIADHLRAATFLIADGVLPSNKYQGYFLRRLLRRAAIKVRKLNEDTKAEELFADITNIVVKNYQDIYFQDTAADAIASVIKEEIIRFNNTLVKGLRQFDKYDSIDGKVAFDLLQTFGFPWELTLELASEKGQTIDKEQFAEEFKKHQELSRTGSAQLFKGGLADQSATVTQFHTTTHLLHQALRLVLGTHVRQMGSNITSERLRFDFKHPDKLTPEQLTEVENIINQKIQENLPVVKTIEDKEEALKAGALAFFKDKYPDKVSVYTIGTDTHNFFSKELCGGPHVASTSEIKPVTIKKEESVGAGIRRIYIVFKS